MENIFENIINVAKVAL